MPFHELISLKTLWQWHRRFLHSLSVFSATRICHCTDLMKFILLSTLADNYKLNLPSSYIWSSFLRDWRVLEQIFTLSALYVRLRNSSTGSSQWKYNYRLLSPLLVIPLIKTTNNYIYSRYLRVGAKLQPFATYVFENARKINSTWSLSSIDGI